MQIAHPCPEGELRQKRKFNQCQNPDFAKPNNMGASEPYFNISFILSTDASYMTGDASDYLQCIRILAAFSYLGLPTHGLGTRLEVDNIEFTLVIMVTIKRENPRPTVRDLVTKPRQIFGDNFVTVALTP